MDQLDIRISRRLRAIMKRVEKVVLQETGETLGVALLVFPWTRPGQQSRVAEFQYISNIPRADMRSAIKGLVQKWAAGMPDVPPHEKQ